MSRYQRKVKINQEIRSIVADTAANLGLTLDQVQRAERKLQDDILQREKNRHTISMMAAELYPPRVKARSKRGWTTPVKG